jgi:RNA polymerase sigma factor (sigma-70 family)
MCKKLINSKYEEYRDKVTAYLMRRFPMCRRDKILALDIYHDALASIHLSCVMNEDFELRKDFLALVILKSYRRAVDISRIIKNNPTIVDLPETFNAEDEGVVIEMTYEQCMFELIVKSMDKLKAECGKLLKLRYVEGKGWKDIAQALGIKGKVPEKTAEKRAKRCMDKLEKIVRRSKKCDGYK